MPPKKQPATAKKAPAPKKVTAKQQKAPPAKPKMVNNRVSKAFTRNNSGGPPKLDGNPKMVSYSGRPRDIGRRPYDYLLGSVRANASPNPFLGVVNTGPTTYHEALTDPLFNNTANPLYSLYNKVSKDTEMSDRKWYETGNDEPSFTDYLKLKKKVVGSKIPKDTQMEQEPQEQPKEEPPPEPTAAPIDAEPIVEPEILANDYPVPVDETPDESEPIPVPGVPQVTTDPIDPIDGEMLDMAAGAIEDGTIEDFFASDPQDPIVSNVEDRLQQELLRYNQSQQAMEVEIQQLRAENERRRQEAVFLQQAIMQTPTASDPNFTIAPPPPPPPPSLRPPGAPRAVTIRPTRDISAYMRAREGEYRELARDRASKRMAVETMQEEPSIY